MCTSKDAEGILLKNMCSSKESIWETICGYYIVNINNLYLAYTECLPCARKLVNISICEETTFGEAEQWRG